VLIPCEPLPLFLLFNLSRIYGLDHSEISTSFYTKVMIFPISLSEAVEFCFCFMPCHFNCIASWHYSAFPPRFDYKNQESMPNSILVESQTNKLSMRHHISLAFSYPMWPNFLT
jgi:hypothetical protein